MTNLLRICKICILDEKFPGILFNQEGICHFCEAYAGRAGLEEEKTILRDQIERLFEGVKGKFEYDCLIAFSGGKDSTYILKMLSEKYGLNCLAITVDNGFISEKALKNCRRVTQELGVDFQLYQPSFAFMKSMYRESVREKNLYTHAATARASLLCNSCINLINNYMIKIALTWRIPIIAGGYMGGQVPQHAAVLNLNLSVLKKFKQASLEKYMHAFGPEARRYFGLDLETIEDGKSDKIVLLNPMLVEKVPESKILDDIKKLGWEKPSDTGEHSTNCRLNDLGIYIHYRRYGFHPYVFEMSEQVRIGLLDRNAALQKVKYIPSFKLVEDRARTIGLHGKDIS